MDFKQQLQAEEALAGFYRKLGDSGPRLITPDILKRQGFKVPNRLHDIFFIGFDKTMPLRIPRGLHVLGDVWIVSSIIEGALDVRVDGDVNFIASEVLLLDDFSHVGGIRTYDEESLKSHIVGRGYHRNPANIVAKRYRYDAQRQRLLDKFSLCEKVDLLDYLSFFKGVKVSLETDGSYIVEGDVYLHGPYEFLIPEEMTIKGNLLLHDTVEQHLPNSLQVLGSITAGSFF